MVWRVHVGAEEERVFRVHVRAGEEGLLRAHVGVAEGTHHELSLVDRSEAVVGLRVC